jgi:hypothetical protein
VFRATIVDIEPPIWRLIRVPDDFLLHQLHRVLQLAFGWLDYHLHEFRVGSRRIEGPHEEAQSPTTLDVALRDLHLVKGSRLTYVYDFGDDWEHELEVVDFLPMPEEGAFDWSPRLIDGARAGPPEDAGGPPGYARCITALGDLADPEHDSYRDWLGSDYDPDAFNVWSSDRALALASAWGAV